ncbi:MAG: glycosyltransferase, partial [Ginsengibacter sp.]
MLNPIKLLDIELTDPINSLTGLEDYMSVQIMVRLYGRPVGYLTVPVINGSVDNEVLNIPDKFNKTIIRIALQNALAAGPLPTEFCLADLFNIRPSAIVENLPLITVVVCTRDRANDLAHCLDAISQLDYTNLDLLVIDNAPSNNDTEMLLKNRYPYIRYVKEPRPGLNWARNRAIVEARGEIIAYTDDDVMVDKKWVNELAILFVENPEVMVATGLVVPFELETKPQVLFEMYGGFGKGFERKWFRKENKKMPWKLLGAGQFGTGANMAYRRTTFDEIGHFDPALDVGTVTNGGGDLEMFFRVLKEGYTLVYEPAAFVRHRHRRTYGELRYQITNNSKGFLSYCIRSINAYPDELFSFIKLLIWWIRYWILRRLIRSYSPKSNIPRDLIIAEIQGSFKSLFLYSKARKSSIKISKQFESEPEIKPDYTLLKDKGRTLSKKINNTAVRLIDLNEPTEKIRDIDNYSKVRLFVKWNKLLLGYVDIFNDYQPVSRSRVIQHIAQYLGLNLFRVSHQKHENIFSRHVLDGLKQRYSVVDENKICMKRLPPEIAVSVVVATYDRPDDLRNCLRHLVKQISPRLIEIIVVDNNPISGLSAPVVNEFPEVILINEALQGLSYARNAGINSSTGDIVLTTDDDVTVPPDWVENIVSNKRKYVYIVYILFLIFSVIGVSKIKVSGSLCIAVSWAKTLKQNEMGNEVKIIFFMSVFNLTNTMHE